MQNHNFANENSSSQIFFRHKLPKFQNKMIRNFQILVTDLKKSDNLVTEYGILI